ncbi:MAG: hypothetical protein ACFFCI_02205 [Promethearchaeota archaeon]
MSLVNAAYTDDIDIDDLDYDKQSDDDVDIDVDITFRFNDNYTVLMFYQFLVTEADDDLEDKLGTTKHTYGVYVNGTNGTSGLVSKTYTFTLDESEADDLSKGEDIRIYVRAYNGTTVTSSKLIESTYEKDDWPYGTSATSGWSQYLTYTNLVIFLIGASAAVILIYAANRRKRGKPLIP